MVSMVSPQTDMTATEVTHYGEDHPRPIDDRCPMILVILDGLGDRAHAELADAPDGAPRTASEAAATPVLDELTRRGESGVLVPLGWGRAAASEIAHWSLFGFSEIDFPGRTRLEALGHGLVPEPGTLLLFGALRPSSTDGDGRIWITGRVRRNEPEVARQLLETVRTYETATHRFALTIFDRGECILTVTPRPPYSVEAVTDTDPFFEHLHPMMQPLALRSLDFATVGSGTTATALAEYLRWVRAALADDVVNRDRIASGLPALDTLTTKWASVIDPVPSFRDVTGVRGAMVPTSPFYRGLGRLLGMDAIDATRSGDALADSLAAARHLVDRGAQFVHVHTKVTDEAGHTKDPHAKKAAVEWCDAQLAALIEPPFSDWVVAVTGDHATPASGGVLHSGDPTPFVIAGPSVRPDGVSVIGEVTSRQGALGVIAASDVLPLMCSHANRPRFLGHRPSPYPTIALPDDPTPFR
jgi:2,3-bisphosphoglycerate-independent phosphoglycerate mutase